MGRGLLPKPKKQPNPDGSAQRRDIRGRKRLLVVSRPLVIVNDLLTHQPKLAVAPVKGKTYRRGMTMKNGYKPIVTMEAAAARKSR